MRFDFDASAAIAIVFARGSSCLDESRYAIDDLIISYVTKKHIRTKDSIDKWVFICPIL